MRERGGGGRGGGDWGGGKEEKGESDFPASAFSLFLSTLSLRHSDPPRAWWVEGRWGESRGRGGTDRGRAGRNGGRGKKRGGRGVIEFSAHLRLQIIQTIQIIQIGSSLI